MLADGVRAQRSLLSEQVSGTQWFYEGDAASVYGLDATGAIARLAPRGSALFPHVESTPHERTREDGIGMMMTHLHPWSKVMGDLREPGCRDLSTSHRTLHDAL